jgi:hypothetical protein
LHEFLLRLLAHGDRKNDEEEEDHKGAAEDPVVVEQHDEDGVAKVCKSCDDKVRPHVSFLANVHLTGHNRLFLEYASLRCYRRNWVFGPRRHRPCSFLPPPLPPSPPPIPQLLDKGHRVSIVARTRPSDLPRHEGVAFCAADVSDAPSVARVSPPPPPVAFL